MRPLLDTNIVIDILNDRLDAGQFALSSPAISAITAMEIYALAGISKEEERRMAIALGFMAMISVNFTIAKRAGLLARTRSSRSRRADLIIAATAMELGRPLFTRNIKDFRGIPGLRVVTKL